MVQTCRIRMIFVIIVIALIWHGTALCSQSMTMIASYYWQPQSLASGGRFNPRGLTAAHRSLPFGTKLRVCLHGCVIVIVNDRGPFVKGRTLDLSLAAAKAIGLVSQGVSTISVEHLR